MKNNFFTLVQLEMQSFILCKLNTGENEALRTILAFCIYTRLRKQIMNFQQKLKGLVPIVICIRYTLGVFVMLRPFSYVDQSRNLYLVKHIYV